MLRSVIHNDSYMPANNLVICFRDRNVLQKSENSVMVEGKINREELPEIRAKKIAKLIESNKKTKPPNTTHMIKNKSASRVQKTDELLESKNAE